jgi:hypothetical protein
MAAAPVKAHTCRIVGWVEGREERAASAKVKQSCPHHQQFLAIWGPADAVTESSQ